MSNRISIQPVSNLINLDFLPNEFNFIQEGSDFIFDRIYYKNLRKTFIGKGEGWVTNLDIVIDNKVGFDIGNTGLGMFINPSEDQTNTELNFTVEFSWLINRYLSNFDFQNFSWTPTAVLNIITDIFELDLVNLLIALKNRNPLRVRLFDFEVLIGVINDEYQWDGTPNEIIFRDDILLEDISNQLKNQEKTISNFLQDFTIDEDLLPENYSYEDVLEYLSSNDDFVEEESLEEFVINLNETYNISIIYTNDLTYEDIASDLEANDISQSLILSKYILQDVSHVDEAYDNLKEFIDQIAFSTQTPLNLRTLIIPYFGFSLNDLNIVLQFPRKWLQPVDDVFQQIPEPTKSALTFNIGTLEYSTQSGFQFVKENSFSLTRSEIANTGIIAEFDGLKVDLSNDSNIPEAIADGRPENFKGVYAQLAAITLPPRWFDSADNHPGTTARVAGYDLLIGTGGVSGTIALEAITIPQDTITDYYGDCFTFQYPIAITAADETKEIANSGELIRHLNELGTTPYTFDFPLSLTTTDGEVKTFEGNNAQTAYADFLSECKTAGPPNRLIKKIGGNGFEVWFEAFDITFKQNKVIESNILGGLKIPRLQDANGDIAEIEIFGHFDDNGDFLVSASEKDGFKPFGIKNVIQFHLKSVELGSQDGTFFIGCACDIEFPSPLMQKFLGAQRIPIQRMRIYSDGSFEIIGGTIPVPANFSLNLGPVEVAITNINLGSYQQEYKGKTRKYMVFGFDGAINLGSLGLEARGKGMQYYFTIDKGEFHSEFRIQTIEADIIIPGSASPASATAIIKGYLSIPQPGESPEYIGGVSIKLPKAKIAGSAEFRLQPKYPAFLIDASVEIPTPIPIVPPVSISGFRGLLGFRYIAEKEAVGLKSGPGGDTWYDYYTYPERGVNIRKFRGPDKSEKAKKGFSIGAGATLVTSDGTLLSARVMFILSIPSLFVFDGRANILGTALGLDDTSDPPFFAFIAIGDGSLELGAGINFKLPKSNGNLITLNVGMEAYFPFRNSSAWYVHLGSRQKPNEARVFTLITMLSYLELSAKGMAVGARADFNFDKSFGPAKVKAWLYAEVGGEISFERPQIGGYVAAGGGAEVKFWILNVGISIDTLFGAEVPKPFRIYARVRVCGRIKIGFIKISKCISVDVKWEKEKRVDTTPIEVLPERIADQNVKAISMLTGEAFDLLRMTKSTAGRAPNSNLPVLPMDVFVDLKFQKPVIPHNVRSLIGGISHRPEGSIELIPPEKSVRGRDFRQVEHKYSIESIEVSTWNGSAWVPYNPYKAITIKDNVNVDRIKIGYWQKSEAKYNALRILGDTPFSYIKQGEPGWFIPEQAGISSESLFCKHTFNYVQRANWRNVPLGRRYPLVEMDLDLDITDAIASEVDKFYEHQNLAFTIIGNQFTTGGNRPQADYAVVAKTYSPNFNFSRGLQFNNLNPLVLKYRNASRKVSFKLNTGAKGATFIFYESVFNNTDTRVTFEAFDTVYQTAAQLEEEFEYIAPDTNTISQVKIIPDVANADQIASVREQIETLQDNILDIEVENIETTSAEQEAELARLLNELSILEAQGCRKVKVASTGIGDMMVNDDFIVGKEEADVPPITQSICDTVLFEASWLSDYDHQLSENLPDQQTITEDFQASVDAITNVVEPIWRPDSQYRIHFSLADTVQGTKSTKEFYFGFATSGPVGHYPGPKEIYGVYKKDSFKLNLSQADKDIYAHATLRQYIDYKRSYPNADGNLLLSKPLFYGTAGGNNKIVLFYLKPYAFHMLGDWPAYDGIGDAIENRVEVLVKDPVEDILLNNPPKSDIEIKEIPATQVDWTPDNNTLFPIEHQLYNNLANGDNCMGGGSTITKPKSYVTEVTLNNMKPQKMYTAIVNSKYKKAGATDFVEKEIHNFVFQTSRYINFEAQVKSYLLKNDTESLIEEVANKAVFSIETSISKQNLSTAYAILNGKAQTNTISKNLEGATLDLFDRVIYGLFEITPLDPAATTEFNFIKNTETGDIVALLIRNPEPFNDPKIELDVINGTKNKDTQAFAVMSGATVDTDYKILHAKDYSQILVMYNMNNQIAITAETLAMRFTYLLWNGFEYKRQSSVSVTDILTTTKG